jgi:serine protease AprX
VQFKGENFSSNNTYKDNLDMKQLFSIVMFFVVISGFSQQIPQKYFVAFSDKNGTPYSINDPQAFLSQRAIDRRATQGISIIEEDLPVNPAYVNAVTALGAQLYTRCKWFNGITVKVLDSALLPSIRALSFVQSVTRVTDYLSKKSFVGNRKFRLDEELRKNASTHDPISPASPQSYNYGPSHGQIHLINGDALHDMGYRGQGKVIAVLDAGFLNADVLPAFDSLRAGNQILGTRDFVHPGQNVYQEFWHGEAVLSCMGGDVPGMLIGTAPKASYWLIRTEEDSTENIIEEYNWVAGAELADSVGADVITSSLGYTMFDGGWMNHTCADMNGHTNPSSRGANIAASKGMALSISAGNDGGNPDWTCISSPSDALYALSIAATDSMGNYAWFSSTGFVNGNFVKPNVASDGYNTWVAYPDFTYGYGSGTSFACPVNAGMMACLCQAQPGISESGIRLAIERSASQYSNPDIFLGYGIPNYTQALVYAHVGEKNKTTFRAYPNPFNDAFNITFDSGLSGNADISLISITGNIILHTQKNITFGRGSTVRINDLNNVSPGMYILKVSSGGKTEYLQLVKLQAGN